MTLKLDPNPSDDTKSGVETPFPNHLIHAKLERQGLSHRPKGNSAQMSHQDPDCAGYQRRCNRLLNLDKKKHVQGFYACRVHCDRSHLEAISARCKCYSRSVTTFLGKKDPRSMSKGHRTQSPAAISGCKQRRLLSALSLRSDAIIIEVMLINNRSNFKQIKLIIHMTVC